MSKDRILQVFRGRLARLPVAHHPGLLFNPWVEGFRDHTFGGRAGPSIQASNVFHELGHAAQFGPEEFTRRAKPEGLVFKVRRIFVYDRYCEEPRTAQATERELETFAHQLHLMRLAGCKVTDNEFVQYCGRLMRFMPDWWHVTGENDDERARWCSERIQQHYASIASAEVGDKLTAWLDLTWKRLRRSDAEQRRGYRPVDVRYRVDGSCLTA